MANTRSLCLCTLLVATTLMQGCRGQCDGYVKVLVATEEAKTFWPPGDVINPPDECKWRIRAEDGYIVHIRITMKNADDYWRYLCSREVSLYDGDHPASSDCITTFCIDTDQVFSTSGQNMFVHYHFRMFRWLDFTMEYWATKKGGVSAQCKGHAKELSATEEAKTFKSPNILRYGPRECKWLLKAEDGNIIHLRVRRMYLHHYGWFTCSDGVSLYDGSHSAMDKRITTLCRDTDQVFSTSGQNMFVHYHSRTFRWYYFAMEYWATKKNNSQIRDYVTTAPTISVPLILIVASLLICSTILFFCCCCCFCRPAKRRPPIRAELTSPAPFSDSAPPSTHTHHDDQGLVIISTRGHSSTSRTDGIRANSSSAVPLLSAPQPEASNMGRRSLVYSPPAYDDLGLVVISTGGNSSTSRTDGIRANTSSAFPLLSAPQPEASNMGRRSLADSPPAYDDLGLVVTYTRGNSSTSRTDGIRANSSSAFPLLSAPQPEASNMRRRTLTDAPPVYDDLGLVVISTGGNSSTSSGVHTSPSTAVPVTAEPPLEDFNMDRRSLVDSPPAYVAVVTSDINRSEENPLETLTVRLPSYSEAVAMVNMAPKPK